MLKKIFVILYLFATLYSFAQDDNRLASDYFRKGEFEKAANLYQKLYDNKKHSIYIFKKLIKSWQALDDYEKVENLMNERFILFPKQHFIWVEKGYNFDLQHKTEQAKIYYEKAAEAIRNKPSAAYPIAKSFQENHLLDYALQGYLLMREASSMSNYNYQIAAIYGEKGDIEKMFDTYLDMVETQEGSMENIQNFIGKYINDDPQDSNNILFRKLLIKRLQQNPNDEWNKLLSWIYLQQKDFAKALIQEKAIHKRSQTDLSAIINLGLIAFESQDFINTKSTFNYVLGNTLDIETKINAQYYLLESEKILQVDKEYMEDIYQNVLKQYGGGNNTIKIQVSYADFLTFHQNKPNEAIKILEACLKNRINRFQKAEIKILLADILVFTSKYNQALITYSQVQTQLKNHVLAQEARYKVARTSYFKGDFEWANIQLKVLKQGTTKLIANDAIDLSLLIDDNIAQDSIQTALKSYAKADLLSYQNKDMQAIDTLSQVLKKHKGHPIEDETLFKQAQLFEKVKQFESAEQNYLSIIKLKENDILLDDAIFHLAQLYDTHLDRPDSAKDYYEKIVLEQPSSIYLVTSRKRFRQLRGDALVP